MWEKKYATCATNKSMKVNNLSCVMNAQDGLTENVTR